MQTISLHEKLNVVFITGVKEHEQTYIMLKKTGFTVSCEDLTKDNAGNYPVIQDIPQVVFTVSNLTAKDVVFIQSLLAKI